MMQEFEDRPTRDGARAGWGERILIAAAVCTGLVQLVLFVMDLFD